MLHYERIQKMKEKIIETVKKYLPYVLAGAFVIGTALGVAYGTAVTVMGIILALLGWV